MEFLSAEEQRAELAASLALTRQLRGGPYVFCHPFNRQVDLDFAALGISAAGFQTRTSDQPISFHALRDGINPYALSSWAVRERHFDAVVDQLERLPDDSWTILAFHSFDGEGHEPWSATRFQALVSACRGFGINIATISSMVKEVVA